jgi:transketolase
MLSIEKNINSKNNKPKIIVCNTIKGKGLCDLENTPKAHHTIPKIENIQKIIDNLCK